MRTSSRADSLGTNRLQSPTCPDPAGCARQLEEKWRQGYHALFRFGMATLGLVSAE